MQTGKTAEVVKKAHADEQLALQEWDKYRRAKDLGHTDYIERAHKCDRFYRGDQWDEQDKKKLSDQGRPALTINQILPTINVILGEQIQRRADVRFKPAHDGKEEIASVLTKLVQAIMEQNDYDSKESEVFADGIIQERGYFDIRINFDETLTGHVEINVEDPLDIIPDPNGKSYDPETWTEVTRTRWWSLDEIEAEYGKQARDRVQAVATNDRTQGPDSFKFENTFSPDENRTVEAWASSDVNNRVVRSVRVLERQFYQNDSIYYLVDPRTGDKKRAPANWNRERRRAFATEYNLFLHRTTEKRVRWRVCADKVLLHDEWSPYGSFTIVPYFPLFRRGQTVGAVTNLIDPQELLNKLSSQELHVVNTTANSGWMVERGGLANMTTEELADKGAETGLVLEYKTGGAPPEKIKPNSIPTGIDRISLKATSNIREISGINEGMLGLTGSEVSGVAIDSKEKRGQVQLQVPLDNLARTRKLVAKHIVDLVQAFYTEPRVINIVRDLPMEGTPEFEQLTINQPTPEGEMLNDVTDGHYDVVISSQPSRDTFNDTQFAEALALRNINVMIPDDRLIEYSNLDKKYALAEEVRSMTGRGEQSPEEAQMAAMMQQMELQGLQLNLMKLEAEVMELRAKAQKLAVETGAIPEELQLKLSELEMKTQLEREGYEVRARLAMEQSYNALEKIRETNRGKRTQAMIESNLKNSFLPQ